MKRATVWTFLAVLGATTLLFAFSCGGSGGGGDKPNGTMTLSVDRGDCPDTLTNYTIYASKPYDRAFAGSLSATPTLTTWPALPEGNFSFQTVLDATIDGAAKQFTYTSPINKSWLPEDAQAALTLSCQALAAQSADTCGHPDAAYLDPAPQKPALLWSLATVNAVFTVAPACNWFTNAELLRKVKDETSGSVAYSLIGTTDLANARRGMIYWHTSELAGGNVEMLLRLTMKGGQVQEGVPFIAPISEGARLDFEIGCDAAKATHFVRLRTGGAILCPGQIPSVDGDTDGESEAAEQEEAEAAEDGDTDGESEAESEADSDTSESDGDLDTEQLEADEEADGDSSDTEEAEEACGTTNPDFNTLYTAEATFDKGKSVPSDLAAIVTTTNAQFSDGTYVRLDATETGGELDFTFNLVDPWAYKFLVTFVGGDKGYGIVSLYIDGSPTPLRRSNVPVGQNAEQFDLNFSQIGGRPEWQFTMEPYEPFCLDSGVHTLRVKVVGSTSTGFKAGLDRFFIVSN